MATAIASLAFVEGTIVIVSIICAPHLPRCRLVCEDADIFQRYNFHRGQHVCRNGRLPSPRATKLRSVSRKSKSGRFSSPVRLSRNVLNC